MNFSPNPFKIEAHVSGSTVELFFTKSGLAFSGESVMKIEGGRVVSFTGPKGLINIPGRRDLDDRELTRLVMFMENATRAPFNSQEQNSQLIHNLKAFHEDVLKQFDARIRLYQNEGSVDLEHLLIDSRRRFVIAMQRWGF